MGRKMISLGDEKYVFDDQSLTLNDAFAIKSASGLDLVPFQNGLNTMSPLSLQTLIWWLRQKHGRPEDIRTIDFKIADLRVDEIEDDEPDPTVSGYVPDETNI
jgi:hypothetical protein